MGRTFEEAYASIMNARGEGRIRSFLNYAHKQLDMIQYAPQHKGPVALTIRRALWPSA
jgi:hypothetical protein